MSIFFKWVGEKPPTKLLFVTDDFVSTFLSTSRGIKSSGEKNTKNPTKLLKGGDKSGFLFYGQIKLNRSIFLEPQMTSSFEGQPPKTRLNFQSNKGPHLGSRFIEFLVVHYECYV